MNKIFQFSVNTWIFGAVPIEEIIRRAKSIGFDGIELVGEPKVYRAAVVRHLAEEAGLKVLSICGMHPGSEPDDLRLLSHPNQLERQKGIDYIKACVDLANEVGARSVLVVPSLVGQPKPMVSRQADLQAAIEPLGQAAKYAESAGIILTIEPINRYEVGLIFNINDAIQLAKQVDNPACRIMGDTFHMQIEEGDGIPNAIRRAGHNWLQHLHVADNTREAPGMGTMPWRETLRALYDIDYQGVVSMEPLPKGASPYDARNGHIPAEKLDGDLRMGLEYLQEMCRLITPYVN
jgi:D-psicose/D-tagatose/L-ribulose 3-epimerase